MALFGNEVLRYDFSAPVAAQHKGRVLVMSNRPSDALLVTELLKRSGYLCEPSIDMAAYSAGSASKDDTGADSSGKRYVATVLCHRATDAQEQGFITPGALPGQRIIVLSDCGAENTIVSLLEGGAHHVFCMRESNALLQARLEAALRQHSRLASKSFRLGDIHFDVPKRRVTRGGEVVNLSPKEYDLAYYLFSNRDRIVGNSELMTSIWSLPSSMDTRRIDTAACRLRKKMKLSASHGWELKRLRRIGYQLIPIDISDMPADTPGVESFGEHLQVVAG